MSEFFRREKSTSPAQAKSPDRIRELAMKIAELRLKDPHMKTFGAEHGHQFRMNDVLSPDKLAEFERWYDVRLPEDFAAFLTRIGDGGIGPGYGLYSLEKSVSDHPSHACRGFLASPFPLTDYFNPYGNDKHPSVGPAELLVDDEFGDERYLCGSIVLSHEGCGYYYRLVITGPQSGQVWFDGRGSDQGLSPCGVDFYTWYERWVRDSLAKL